MKKRNFLFLSINFRTKRKIIRFFIVLTILIVLILLYLNFLVNPIIFKTTDSKMKTLANRSMNLAVTEAMNQNITYDDLIEIMTDNSGKISMIQANSIQINALAKFITKTVQVNFRDLSDEPLQIPVGTLSGIPLFTGRGPSVKIKISPFGDISCKFASEFVSAGINQTQHKIYLNITTNIHIVLPTQSFTVVATSDLLVCESVIIGEIPSTFLKSDSLDEMMNLIPL